MTAPIRRWLCAAAVALAGPASAQTSTPIDHPRLIEDTGPPAPSLIACSYNDAGVYTGADSANPGEQAGAPVRTGSSGDYAWRWVIAAADGNACPRSLPN